MVQHTCIIPASAPVDSQPRCPPRPAGIDIGNWRQTPYNQWAFQHVRELIPTAAIPAVKIPQGKFAIALENFDRLQVDSPAGFCRFTELLQQSHSDGLLVLHNGKIIYQWNAPHFDPDNPHILFSVSKSVTAMLAGILESRGMIDCDAPIVHYLPLVNNSVYGNCHIRHLLDMSVALDFEENYTDRNSEYMQYRIATGWNPVDQNKQGPGLESFLYSLKQSTEDHGHAFLYRSPNSDLLGLLLERVAGEPLAGLFSRYLWRPMGAQSDGYITVDPGGLGRAAGGICITLHDFGRIGQLFLDQGEMNGVQVLPTGWIEDTRHNGNQLAWNRGNYKHKLPNGNYRNQWYQIGDPDQCMSARGIHGQLLYINPTRSVVIAKLASQPAPLNDQMTTLMLSAFDKISQEIQ